MITIRTSFVGVWPRLRTGTGVVTGPPPSPSVGKNDKKNNSKRAKKNAAAATTTTTTITTTTMMLLMMLGERCLSNGFGLIMLMYLLILMPKLPKR
jgi:hypothetical protein